MKIILVIDRIVTGGAERILIDYYHHLEQAGHEPHIFALSGCRRQSEWVNDLKVVYGTPSDEDNVLKKAVQQLLLLLKLRKMVKTVKPDAIFSFLEKSNLLTMCVPAGGATKVVSVHNVLSIQYTKLHNRFIKSLVYRMIRTAYNHCANVVAVSKQVKDDLVVNFEVDEKNVIVINNFVDRKKILEKTLEPINDFHFKNDVKYVMNIGRFSDQKAQWKLIKAFSLYLRDTSLHVELIMIGAGKYADSLKKLANDLGLSNVVHVLPFNVNPYKYMKMATLFVLSSIYEGFPIVLAEVSSLGIPFVGSRKSVPEEMFDNDISWNQVIFDNLFLEKDFGITIHEDEIELSKLLKRGVEDEKFRLMIKTHTEKWNRENFKSNQFTLYDHLWSNG